MTYLVGSIWSVKLLSKRLFICGLLLASLVFALSASLTFAQGGGADAGSAGTRPAGIDGGLYAGAVNAGGNPGGTVGAGGGSDPTVFAPGPTTDASVAAAQAAAAAQAQATADSVGQFDDPVLQFLHKYILTGIGSFVAYTGKAFDYAIEEYIIGFGNLYINKNVGAAIDSLWSTVRDIFNLTFIFGLVYIGFKMILDSSDSNARKMLISLIGAALLVNFSLFITKFVVDFSNIAASQIYEAFGDTDSLDFSITNGFMTMMGVGEIMKVKMTASAGYAYIVGMLIVFAVLIYVFLAGAIMIIIRFVVLCIYMVFSPMMFLGWVFPAMQGHSSKYWKGFLNQAFFAPAFIFMLYLSYRVTYTFNYTMKDWGHFFGQGVADPVGVDGLIPFFAMVVIFLLASIMVAKNMGAVGAATAISVGNKMRSSAQGVMYRNTGGRLSKGALNLMDRTGLSNLPGTRSLRSAIKSGYEYGAGGTGLAKTRSDIESEKADITKNRSRMTSAEHKANVKNYISEGREGAAELVSLRGKRDSGIISVAETARLNVLEEKEAKMHSAITGMDIHDLEKMSSSELQEIAPNLTPTQVSSVMKSEKIGTSTKDKLHTQRKDRIKNKIGPNATPSEVQKLTRNELETLGTTWLSQNAHKLSFTQTDDIIKSSNELSDVQKEALKANRKRVLLQEIEAGTAKPLLEKLSAKDFANLPKEVFTNTKYGNIVPDLKVGVLEHIAKENIIDQDERFAMKKFLMKSSTPTSTSIKTYLASDKGKEFYGT